MSPRLHYFRKKDKNYCMLYNKYNKIAAMRSFCARHMKYWRRTERYLKKKKKKRKRREDNTKVKVKTGKDFIQKVRERIQADA